MYIFNSISIKTDFNKYYSIGSILFFVILLSASSSFAQSLDDRLLHNNPEDYRLLSSVHKGAGEMEFTQIIGRGEMATNFLYLHSGEIKPKGGIGHHFHHKMEEMYVLLSGEAEFTINGRTSILKAPVAVPCKMGDSHAVYNHTDEPIKWLNYAVSEKKINRDRAFDLGDDRVGATIDDIPIFVASQLDKGLLRSENHPYGDNKALYRRALLPGIFTTNWNHVDHVVVQSGNTSTPRQLKGIEEVYYVMNGSGTMTIDGKSVALRIDDVITATLGETMSFSNSGSEDLELLVIGIAASKSHNMSGPKEGPEAMALQMDFVVEASNHKAFEDMYHSIYVPAMTVQDGYISSKLLRLYSEDDAKAIEAEPTTYNYQIQISFDTEENRRKWVASDQHKIAWPAATSLAKEFKWRGYDVMGNDVQDR